MGKKILAVVGGYLTTFLAAFLLFTIIYFILGPEESFLPESYKVSALWLVFSFLVNVVAALAGGYICMLVGNNKKVVLILALLVLILGVVMAIPALTTTSEFVNQVRDGAVGNMDAMMRAQQPKYTFILNPIIGAIGVYFGAKLRKPKV